MNQVMNFDEAFFFWDLLGSLKATVLEAFTKKWHDQWVISKRWVFMINLHSSHYGKCLLTGLMTCILCWLPPTALTAVKQLTAKQHYHKGRQALKGEHYESAIKHFESVLASSPFSEYGKSSRLGLIDAYWQSYQYDLVITQSDLFLRYYPNTQHSDYALFVRGMARFIGHQSWFEKYFNLSSGRFNMSTEEKSFFDFQAINTHFPNSRLRPMAVYAMRKIQQDLAMHEFNIARHYAEKHAYLASANRLVDLIRKYPQADLLPKAVNLLKTVYLLMGMNHYAQDLDAIVIRPCGLDSAIRTS